jgi:hypothetical protein
MLASQRERFDVPREICYLNSASYSPLPLRTLEAGRAAVGRKGRPWTLDADFARGQHERARTAAARLINADPADIALIWKTIIPRRCWNGIIAPKRRPLRSRQYASPVTATGPRRSSR